MFCTTGWSDDGMSSGSALVLPSLEKVLQSNQEETLVLFPEVLCSSIMFGMHQPFHNFLRDSLSHRAKINSFLMMEHHNVDPKQEVRKDEIEFEEEMNPPFDSMIPEINESLIPKEDYDFGFGFLGKCHREERGSSCQW